MALSGKKAVLILPSFAALHICVFVFFCVFVFALANLCDTGQGRRSGTQRKEGTSLAALRLFGSAGSFMPRSLMLWC